jgi:hypothetical protein
MRAAVYRYDFNNEVPMDEVEASIVLALLGTESLHGECDVQLAAPHYLDRERRTCIVDGSTALGRDFNRLLLGFLRREFGSAAIRIQVVDASRPEATSATYGTVR